MKRDLKRRLHQLITGENPEGSIEIYYIVPGPDNQPTGEVIKLETFPSAKSLRIEAADRDTAETFVKLFQHEKTILEK